jgi:putative FmdB family regulatory protein
MPIYEYECAKCSHYLEALQKISDKPLRECPECGKHALKRLVSAPMFRLSGSGWYETDFKSDKETKRNLVDKGDKDSGASENKSAATPDTKTSESKPDTKAEIKPAASEPKPERSRTMVTKPAVKPSASKAGKKAPARKAPARRGKR